MKKEKSSLAREMRGFQEWKYHSTLLLPDTDIDIDSEMLFVHIQVALIKCRN